MAVNSETVWVQTDGDGTAVRIFRSKKSCAQFQRGNPEAWVREMSRRLAVGQIRLQVFTRDEFTCVHCGKPVTVLTGEMDERQARGETKLGEDGNFHSGEISVENSQTLCCGCHTQNQDAKHDRHPVWSVQERGQAV